MSIAQCGESLILLAMLFQTYNIYNIHVNKVDA